MEKDYKYLVSTLCMTYNQAPFIEDTLRGFAMQDTSFPVIYILIDDASSDGEPEVLSRWINENLEAEEGNSLWKEMPYGQLALGKQKGKQNNIFAILLLAKNHYKNGIGKRRIEYMAAWNDNAKYIANCEGDDYWIDPKKLQKQVDFLENHPDVGMCYTNFNILTDSTGEIIKSVLSSCPNEYSYDYTLGDWIRKKNKCYVGPMTWVVKKELWQSIPQIPGSVDGTFANFAYYKYESKTYCLLDETTAVYRINRGSMTQTTTIENSFKRVKGLYLQQLALAERYLESDKIYTIEYIKRKYYTHYFKLIFLLGNEGERAKVKEYRNYLGRNEKILMALCSNSKLLSLCSWLYRIYYIKRKGLDR